MNEFEGAYAVLVQLCDEDGFVYEVTAYGPFGDHEATRFADHVERLETRENFMHYETEVVSLRGADEVPGWGEVA